MKTSDFYYELPKELIAQDPLEDRASSRLMCLSRKTGEVEHHTFRDILQFLDPGDTLVINNTKVIGGFTVSRGKTHTGSMICPLAHRIFRIMEITS